MKVLLLSARNESVGIDVRLPLGLACVFAAAAEKAGHPVRLLSNVAGSEVSAIADAVLQIRTDVIGISARNIALKKKLHNVDVDLQGLDGMVPIIFLGRRLPPAEAGHSATERQEGSCN
ncbi:MAG TPA: hypothetical protein VEV41_24185 [Terriglobales bacterium]|nr:hypothetical protein [Terriglobales bacterium]